VSIAGGESDAERSQAALDEGLQAHAEGDLAAAEEAYDQAINSTRKTSSPTTTSA
jgi:predicted transcriptional regulator